MPALFFMTPFEGVPPTYKAISQKRGTPKIPQNIRILINGTPQTGTLIVGNPHRALYDYSDPQKGAPNVDPPKYTENTQKL